ncbi:MAG: ferredoxin [Candidatus Aenigmatarchaeota archaeon]
MAKIKIIHNVSECIGCGACVSVCPENWEMKGDKSKPKKTELNSIGCNQEAADICPTKCIKIVKK